MKFLALLNHPKKQLVVNINNLDQSKTIVTQPKYFVGLNTEFEMSVLSDLGGRWDVFFLPEVIA